MTRHRIVSLIASATETVAALGQQSELVARSHECDYPADVLDLPAVTRPRIDVSGTSGEIDSAVRDCVAGGLSVYDVDETMIDELEPTLIITQSQCEVCAVNLRQVQSAVVRLARCRPRIVSLAPMRLRDVWSDIQRVADALGITEVGGQVVSAIQSRMQRLRETARRRIDRAPRVLCIEWLNPVMIAANWVPELVELAGGEAVMAHAGEHSSTVEWEEILEADPDMIAIMPCGFDIPRTLREMSLLTARRGWDELSAVRNGMVFVADGNQYFNRPGPRVADSAEILLELLDTEGERSEQYSLAWNRL